MLKNSKDTIKKKNFRHFLWEHILPAKEKGLLGKFQADRFKTDRLVCVQTDGHG